jgi:hypothetical protein
LMFVSCHLSRPTSLEINLCFSKVQSSGCVCFWRDSGKVE